MLGWGIFTHSTLPEPGHKMSTTSSCAGMCLPPPSPRPAPGATVGPGLDGMWRKPGRPLPCCQPGCGAQQGGAGGTWGTSFQEHVPMGHSCSARDGRDSPEAGAPGGSQPCEVEPVQTAGVYGMAAGQTTGCRGHQEEAEARLLHGQHTSKNWAAVPTLACRECCPKADLSV